MASSSDTVLKKGHLKKLPIHSKGLTKKRLFELTDDKLSYYAEKKTQSLKKNSIPLESILRVEKYKTSKKGHGFLVEAKEAESDRYNLRMFAASDHEADEWMKAIEEACQRRKRGADSESKTESSDVADVGEAKTVHTAPSLSIDSVPEESADETGAKTLSEEKELEDSRHSIVSPTNEASVICLYLKDGNPPVSDEEESDDDTPLTAKAKSRSLGRQSRSDSRPYMCVNPWEEVDPSGHRPLHRACQEGNAERVLELLDQEASREAVDTQKRYPPIFHAYTHDHRNILKLLLEKGASADGEEKIGGATLLHFCAERNDMEVAMLLLDHNADVNKEDYAGKSPLHVACAHASLDFIKFLIKRGAAVDKVANGLTALSIASERGRLDIVELLLSHKATVYADTISSRRRSAYVVAVENKHEKIAELLKEALPDTVKPYKCEKALKGHLEAVTSVAVSTTLLVSGAGDGQVILWDLVSGNRLHTFSLRDSVVSLSFWGDFLAAGTQLTTVFDLKSPGWKLEIGLSSGTKAVENRPLQMVAFSADGHLATADIDRNVVEIWSIGPVEGYLRHPLHTIVADERLGDRDGVCQSMQFSPDTSRTLLALSIQPGSRLRPVGNNIINIVDWKTEQSYFCIDTGVGVGSGLMATDTAISFSPDGKYIAVGLNTGEVKMWEVYGPKRLIHNFVLERGCGVRSLAFSSLYGHLAAGLDSGEIHFYSFTSGERLFVLSDGKKAATSLAFSSDGRHLLSGCEDRLLRIYEAPMERPIMSASLTVEPSHPPTKALDENGELSDCSKRFWRRKFSEFDEDNDGFLSLNEFDRLYCEFKNDHMLPHDYEKLCRSRKVSMVDIDTLFRLAADWLWKDGEQMWLTWKKNGYSEVD